MITCYVRYFLDLGKLDAFAEYGRLWISLITRLGGTHHGYFLPKADEEAAVADGFSFPGLGAEGPKNVAVAIYSFLDWEAYQRYRSEAANHAECERATKIANETKCFTRYERNFVTVLR